MPSTPTTGVRGVSECRPKRPLGWIRPQIWPLITMPVVYPSIHPSILQLHIASPWFEWFGPDETRRCSPRCRATKNRYSQSFGGWESEARKRLGSIALGRHSSDRAELEPFFLFFWRAGNSFEWIWLARQVDSLLLIVCFVSSVRFERASEPFRLKNWTRFDVRNGGGDVWLVSAEEE